MLGVTWQEGAKAEVVAEDTGCVVEETAQGVRQTDPALPPTSYCTLDRTGFLCLQFPSL